ncbi:MAG: hypothetical protein VW736_07530, partial [Alphaproteobacteria bacterium]
QGYRIMEFHAPDVTPDRLVTARENSLEIMIYTELDDIAVFQSAISENVDYMNTDFPAAVKELRNQGT